MCGGVPIGIQIPGVADQYAKQIDAYLTEAVYVFIGFQKTTDRYFEGNIQNLLNYYNGSDEAVFEDDAPSFFYFEPRVSS